MFQFRANQRHCHEPEFRSCQSRVAVTPRHIFVSGKAHKPTGDEGVANENMAKALAARGYHYQFVFARNAGHVDGRVKQQTLPEALEWLWQGCQPVAK